MYRTRLMQRGDANGDICRSVRGARGGTGPPGSDEAGRRRLLWRSKVLARELGALATCGEDATFRALPRTTRVDVLLTNEVLGRSFVFWKFSGSFDSRTIGLQYCTLVYTYVYTVNRAEDN